VKDGRFEEIASIRKKAKAVNDICDYGLIYIVSVQVNQMMHLLVPQDNEFWNFIVLVGIFAGLSITMFPIYLFPHRWGYEDTTCGTVSHTLLDGAAFIFALAFASFNESLLRLQKEAEAQDLIFNVIYGAVLILVGGVILFYVKAAEDEAEENIKKRLEGEEIPLKGHLADFCLRSDRADLLRELTSRFTGLSTTYIIFELGREILLFVTDEAKDELYEAMTPWTAFLLWGITALVAALLQYLVSLGNTQLGNLLDSVNIEKAPEGSSAMVQPAVEDFAETVVDVTREVNNMALTAVEMSGEFVLGLASHNMVAALWNEQLIEGQASAGLKQGLVVAYAGVLSVVAVFTAFWQAPPPEYVQNVPETLSRELGLSKEELKIFKEAADAATESELSVQVKS